jgi:hypothetical protein
VTVDGGKPAILVRGAVSGLDEIKGLKEGRP